MPGSGPGIRRTRSTGWCPRAPAGWPTSAPAAASSPPAWSTAGSRWWPSSRLRRCAGSSGGACRRSAPSPGPPRRSRCPTGPATPSSSGRRGTGSTPPGRSPRSRGCSPPAAASGSCGTSRDERIGWVAELGRILHGPERQSMGAENPRIGPPFGPVRRFDTAWVQELSPDGLLELAASRSYVITLPEAERARRLDRVRELHARHPALAGSDRVLLPYVTRCARAELLSPVDFRGYREITRAKVSNLSYSYPSVGFRWSYTRRVPARRSA